MEVPFYTLMVASLSVIGVSGQVDGYEIIEGKYCAFYGSMKFSTHTDAKLACDQDSECHGFFNNCGLNEFRVCDGTTLERTSSCGSIMYRKGTTGLWIQGNKCRYDKLETLFSGDLGYTLEAAKTKCANGCNGRDDCFYADLFFPTTIATQACYLRGKNCGDWQNNENSNYYLYQKEA